MLTSQTDIAQTYAMFSGRAHPRSQGIRPGLISVDGANLTQQCTLDDYNETGARIRVTDPDKVPDGFLVISRAEDLCARCRVVWRRNNDVGVVFEHRGFFADATEMRLRLREKFGKAGDFYRKTSAPDKPVGQKAAHSAVEARPKLRKKLRKLAAECALLNIDPNSAVTLAEVKSTYRKMALRLHPDQGGRPEAFQALSDAYRKLADACKTAGV